jgi:hypothetical protein
MNDQIRDKFAFFNMAKGQVVYRRWGDSGEHIPQLFEPLPYSLTSTARNDRLKRKRYLGRLPGLMTAKVINYRLQDFLLEKYCG